MGSGRGCEAGAEPPHRSGGQCQRPHHPRAPGGVGDRQWAAMPTEAPLAQPRSEGAHVSRLHSAKHSSWRASTEPVAAEGGRPGCRGTRTAPVLAIRASLGSEPCWACGTHALTALAGRQDGGVDLHGVDLRKVRGLLLRGWLTAAAPAIAR